MVHHVYKRSHYYLVLFIFVVLLTAMYVIGLTQIYNDHGDKVSVAPSAIITKIFGNTVTGDLGSGTGTIAAYVTQDQGGSGTFFYAIAFIKNGDKYTNSNAIFLGDRISPQGLGISNGVVSFNYCDRNPDEPFTTPPSVCVTRGFSIKSGTLTEVAQ